MCIGRRLGFLRRTAGCAILCLSFCWVYFASLRWAFVMRLTFELRRFLLWCGLIAVMAFTGCATPPNDPDARAEFIATNDPMEPLNRAIFSFNMALDRTVLRPIAEGYRWTIPEPGRIAVTNVLRNAELPVTMVNQVLQGEVNDLGITATRFIMNTTLGIGGLLDPATVTGLPRKEEDFGQTLAVWGLDSGPYLMLPIIGPSSPRDGVGVIVDRFFDPLEYLFDNTGNEWVSYARFGVRAVDSRSRNIETLDEIESGSIDFYATIRSLYRQRRMDEIRNGEPQDMSMVPDIIFQEDDGAEDYSSVPE